MPRTETDPIRRYHEATKHSYVSVRTSAHALDWANRPRPYKTYLDLPTIPLPRVLRATRVPCLDAIAPPGDRDNGVPDLVDLATLLYLSAGITKRKRYPDGEVHFRAASCTGALYEIDLYVCCGPLDGLDAGVYHFDPRDPALGLLRAGDHRAQLVEASGGEPAVAQAPVVIVCAGTYWRNSWKYRARTYRHFGWDNGTILANALATAAALGLPARVVSGFVDADVNALLALDTAREVAFSLLALGRGGPAPPPAPPLDPIHPRTAAGSRSEVDEPRIREVHEASSLASPDEVRAWRADAAGARSAPGPRGEHRVPLRSLPQGPAPTDALEDVVLRRGSTREFARGASLGLDQLSTLLERSTRGVPADFAPGGALLNRCYLIASAVDGLDAGAYVLHRDPGQLELLKRGEFRAEAGYLGLEQDLPADASAVVFFLADLDGELSRLGRRVYRALQLEAGILGGKMYLAAYAQRFGASGLTFYDDDVVRFFSPHAAGLAAVFVMALGRGAPLPAHGRVEPFVPVTFAPPAADRP